MASEKGLDSNVVLLDMMGKLMRKMDSLSDTVSRLGYRLSTLEQSMEALRGQDTAYAAGAPPTTIDEVQQNLATMIAFSSPFTIIFTGIRQYPGIPLDEIFRRFLIDTLHMDIARVYGLSFCVQQLAETKRDDPCPAICVSCVDSDLSTLIEVCEKNHKALKKLGIKVKNPYLKGHYVREI